MVGKESEWGREKEKEKDAFSMLEGLQFLECQPADDIAVALGQGLHAASRTRLRELTLWDGNLGDRGMAALAGLVRVGRFERLKTLDLSFNDMTDKGMRLLAFAVEESGKRGLPMLLEFKVTGLGKVTSEGREALASALTANCPDWKKDRFG